MSSASLEKSVARPKLFVAPSEELEPDHNRVEYPTSHPTVISQHACAVQLSLGSRPVTAQGPGKDEA
jgi:hypothetical protein